MVNIIPAILVPLIKNTYNIKGKCHIVNDDRYGNTICNKIVISHDKLLVYFDSVFYKYYIDLIKISFCKECWKSLEKYEVAFRL